MRYILTLSFLFINFFIFSQCVKNKENKKLKKIISKEIVNLNKYKFIESNNIEEYNEGFTSSNSKDSLIMKELKITNDVSFVTYKFTPTNYNNFHEDFFKINNIKYEIDSIIKKNKIDLKYYNPYLYLRRFYIYVNKKNKEDRIILIESENRTFYKDREVSSIIILKLDTEKTEISFLYDLVW